MKRLIVASIGVLAIGLTTANAADIRARPAPYPAPAPVYAPPPVYFSWTGCYFGGHIGGLWARKEWTVRDPAFPSRFGQSEGSHDANGFLGGVQAGCDYQFAGGFVIGVAGDYAWTDASGSNASLVFPGAVNHTKIDSLASVTGRLGYSWDRFLGYVKGGGVLDEAGNKVGERVLTADADCPAAAGVGHRTNDDPVDKVEFVALPSAI